MTGADKQTFATLIHALASAFRVEATTALMQGYWLGLEDLAFEDVERAVGQALRSSQRMPAPAELRELAGEMPAAMRAVRAWDALKGAMRRHGAYQSIEFDDRAINAAVRSLGGWQRLCSLESEELDKWTRKDFEKAYLAHLKHGVSDEAGAYLVGVIEATNRFNGHDQLVKPPVTIVTGLPTTGSQTPPRALPAASGEPATTAELMRRYEAPRRRA